VNLQRIRRRRDDRAKGLMKQYNNRGEKSKFAQSQAGSNKAEHLAVTRDFLSLMPLLHRECDLRRRRTRFAHPSTERAGPFPI